MIDFGPQLELSVQIVVAAALGAIIGAEREIHGHPAGIRTHMLVSLGSAIFTIMSIHGFGQDVDPTRSDPTRIAAPISSCAAVERPRSPRPSKPSAASPAWTSSRPAWATDARPRRAARLTR